VAIKSSNKTTDPELLGQEGVVTKVEHNGWIEVHIPKLGEQHVPGVASGRLGLRAQR
jgi:hypothetical protein